MAAKRADDEMSTEQALDQLDESAMRTILTAAAASHEDVTEAIRLAAAGKDERLVVLKTAVDRSLRTRRHLDYWASSSWAAEAAPAVRLLAAEVEAEPSAGLILLLQRAATHLVKVMERADDSTGQIGDLAQNVLDLHETACVAGVADPQKLAKWMIRFSFDDQDFYYVDPVAYVDALGVKGLALFRKEVAKRSERPAESPRPIYGDFPNFAAKYATERLAVIDRDVEKLVELLGGDLSRANQFTRVAEVMLELGETDDALAWARRGIAESDGWQVSDLYDLAAEILSERGDLDGVIDLRRHQHNRAPNATTYARLQSAARATNTWEDESVAAANRLAELNPPGFLDALLADGESDRAWEAATSMDDVAPSQWLRLAEAREPARPADAMAVYLRLADEVLVRADKRAYQGAIRHLKAARRAATAADQSTTFVDHVAELRERNKRRPSFMTMLDKAALV